MIFFLVETMVYSIILVLWVSIGKNNNTYYRENRLI